jgi:toxin-antitoxin system PIN domain toxin
LIIVDINLLLYAVNRDTPQHDIAHAWWRGVLEGDESVGLAWLVILGFIRIATNPRIFPNPLAADEALAIVDDWLRLDHVQPVEPTGRHWGIFKEIVEPLGAAGNLTSDAHLAALAIEHGALLCSADGDFARFAHLRWRNPLAARPTRRR